MYKNIIVFGGIAMHGLYSFLDIFLGYATVYIFSGRVICIALPLLLLRLFTIKKYQFPILLCFAITNYLFALYLTNQGVSNDAGFIILLTAVAVFPLKIREFSTIFILNIIFFVICSFVKINYLGDQFLHSTILISGVFVAIFIIYLIIIKYRGLLIESEQLLFMKNKNLAEKNELLIDMYDQLIHDVKSPLTALKFLSDKNDDRNNLLSQATVRVERIILNLKNENIPIKNYKFNMIDKLNYLTSELLIRYNKTMSLDIKVTIENNLTDKMVSFVNLNTEQFSRIISNLFNNSVEACISEECLISVELSEFNKNLLISISDNGPGISKDKINNVTARNYTTRSGGKGIGLSSAKEVIEKSGGTFKINPGKGFKVELGIIKGGTE